MTYSSDMKLQWAHSKAAEYDAEVDTWTEAGGYRVVFEPQADGVEHVIRLQVKPLPTTLSLILGDILQNLRAGLNHLVYEIAERRNPNLPTDIAERIEFPIFGDRSMTPGEARAKIGALPPDAQTVVESVQPHLKGDRYGDDPLWHLHELARIDRHRLRHKADTVPGPQILMGGNNLRIYEIMLYNVAEASHGTEIGRCRIKPNNPDLPMQMDVTLEPVIIFEGGPLSGQNVAGCIERIFRHIDTDIVPPLLPFR